MNAISNLSLLMWNDVKTQLDTWRTSAIGDGFRDVSITDTQDKAEFMRLFRDTNPDVLIMDIILKSGRPAHTAPFGLELLEAVRQEDCLVPAIAVTVAPDKVLLEGVALEEYGFCGIYPSSALNTSSGLFRNLVRQSLNLWHVQAPEFALAEAGLRGLRRVFPKMESSIALTLANHLNALPHSGAIDAWHQQLSGIIENLLREHDYKLLAEKFAALSSIFEQGDPFYMAGSRSRKHLSHNVQVFLLGLAVLLADTEIRQFAVDWARRLQNGSSDENAITDAVLVWACIGLTHDCAYLSEAMRSVASKLDSIARTFSSSVGITASPGPMVGEMLLNWPTTKHPMVAKVLWSDGADAASKEGKMQLVIAQAIERHDSCYAAANGLGLVGSEAWAQFLAVLSDELQDWHRIRETAVPGIKEEKDDGLDKNPWRNFAVEKIKIESEGLARKCRLSLDFAIQDHRTVVKDAKGQASTDMIRRRFRSILAVLEQNLKPRHEWEISLRADFVSRRVANVVEKAALEPTAP